MIDEHANDLLGFLLSLDAMKIKLRIRRGRVVASPRSRITKKMVHQIKFVTPEVLRVYKMCVKACKGSALKPEVVFNNELNIADVALLATGEHTLRDLKTYLKAVV
jgi:hypothetical protein